MFLKVSTWRNIVVSNVLCLNNDMFWYNATTIELYCLQFKYNLLVDIYVKHEELR